MRGCDAMIVNLTPLTRRRTIPSVAATPQCIKLAILPRTIEPHWGVACHSPLWHSRTLPQKSVGARPLMRRARPNGLQTFAALTVE